VTAALDKLDWCLRTIDKIRPFLIAVVPDEVVNDPIEELPGVGNGDTLNSLLPVEPLSDREPVPSTRVTRPETRANGEGIGERANDQRAVADAARDLADSGRIDAAIELLDRARQSARCRRDRFLRQLELVEVCIRGRLIGVARPLLDELADELGARSLEEWEDPALCSRVLGAWLICLRASQSDDDASKIPDIYVRLCRLDPRSALRHSDGQGGMSR
jgi:hypothetical protein